VTPLRRSYDSGDRKSSSDDIYESAVVEILVQEHGAAQTNLLVIDVLGRLMSAGVAVLLTLGPELSVTRLVSALLVIVLVGLFWQWGRRRAWRRIFSVEETLSRVTGGVAERAYIESRFIAESGQGQVDLLHRLEPLLWLGANLAIALTSLLSSGIS